ncbi:MAG: hypothetical protein ACFFEY_05265 [Candidatus Thorarchaeota archaeon]
MQIFEVVELLEYPYMETRELVEGQIVSDVLNEKNKNKVFLLIDHALKRIWTYNGPKSHLKLQIYGSILADMLRKQLKLFYRIYLLNKYTGEEKEFKNLLEKQIGAGKAKPILKQDFHEIKPEIYSTNIYALNPNINKALEYIEEFPPPDSYIRRFTIVGGTIFTSEEDTESFLNEEKIVTKTIKLGRLNNGFTFFQDHNYSTRIIIKERMIQGIELFIDKKDKSPTFKIEIPIIQEDKFKKPGSINSLINAFQTLKKLKEEEKENNS